MDYQIEVSVLGECSVTVGRGNEKKGVDLSQRRVWTLFEYLFFNSDRYVSRDMVKEALWGDKNLADISNSLKVLIYEIRRAFDDAVPGLGMRIIRQRYGTYYMCRRDGISFRCDAEDFAAKTRDALISRDLKEIEKAKTAYTGSIQITAEESIWQRMLREHYHAYFRCLVMDEIGILLEEGDREAAIRSCTEAILSAPEEKAFRLKYAELTGELNHGDSDGEICAMQ